MKKYLPALAPVGIFVSTMFLSSVAYADVVPAFVLSNNAVLQRDKPIPVWGTADAGEKVSVSFSGKIASATADA
jgi:sialate O-acetylesterase